MKMIPLSLVGALTLAFPGGSVDQNSARSITGKNADSVQRIIDALRGEGVSRNEKKEIELQDARIIQELIDSTLEGGTIDIPEGHYIVHSPLIPKKGQKLLGSQQGTFLKLADKVNQPVVIVENDDIEVAGLTIDGNSEYQSQEQSVRKRDKKRFTCANCITVCGGMGAWSESETPDLADKKECSGVFLHHLVVKNARSAGICSQFGVKDMRIEDVVAYHNVWDGIAGCETEKSFIRRVKSFANGAAGFSYDCDSTGNQFIDLEASDNKHCAFYGRAFRDNYIQNGTLNGMVHISTNHAYAKWDRSPSCGGRSWGNIFDGTVVDKNHWDIRDGNQVVIKDPPKLMSSGGGGFIQY